jgi:2'-5' RNA ligase
VTSARRAAAAVLFGALAVSPCLGAALSCPADGLDKDGRGSVLLFSALPLNKTKFAKQWDKSQKELATKFPGLRFEKSDNLHITLAFMGAGWDPAKIDVMEKYGLDGPDLSSGPLKMKGAPDLFGSKKEVVALHLTPVPEEWANRLMKDRQTMTDLVLRKRDPFDDVFAAHVSLASAPKPDEQREELARFQKWMADHASRFGGLNIPIDRSIKPKYFVVLGKAETTRFVPLREYCAASPVSPAAR